MARFSSLMSPRRSESATTIVANHHSSAIATNWNSARTKLLETGQPATVLAWRTAAVDTLVAEAYRECLPGHAGLSLLGVGGYGRRQLFPYSDVDLLLLFDSEKSLTGAKRVLAPFLQRLWDAGLRVS